MKFEWKTLQALVLGAVSAVMPSWAAAAAPKEIRVGYPVAPRHQRALRQQPAGFPAAAICRPSSDAQAG